MEPRNEKVDICQNKQIWSSKGKKCEIKSLDD